MDFIFSRCFSSHAFRKGIRRMIHLSQEHLYGLIIFVTLAGLSLIAFTKRNQLRQFSGLILWISLLYAGFLSLIAYDAPSSLLSFTGKQSGILFFYAALLMIPPFIHFTRYESAPFRRNISFYPFLLFFLAGSNHPLVWLAAYEGLSYLLASERKSFQSDSFKIRYLTASLILFTSVMFMSIPAGQIITKDIASLLLFSGLVIRLYTPPFYEKKGKLNQQDFYYLNFLQFAFTAILLIKVNPVIHSFYGEITGIFLLLIAVITCVMKYLTDKRAETLVEITINSLFIPVILLSTTPSTHQYILYVFLSFPLIILFSGDAFRMASPRRLIPALMTIHGIPLTAGSLLWIHTISGFQPGSTSVWSVYTGILLLLVFWIFLYRELMLVNSHLREPEKKIVDPCLLIIILINVLLWLFFGKFPDFFGF